MLTFQQCEDLIFASYNRVGATLKGEDSVTRDLKPMQKLFELAQIPTSIAPTITVTGSKGKGSTAILCAGLLQACGHRVGLLTSPQFLSHRERIRLDGIAISEEAFSRIVNDLSGMIYAIEETLSDEQYLSPTGLFLAVAVRFFIESGVTATVFEVGRGGLYDDVRLMENQVSCITPIMGEHHDKLGASIQHIAAHKAGIIKKKSHVVSAPQSPDALEVLQRSVQDQEASMYLVGRDIHLDVTRHGFRQDVTIHMEDLAQPITLSLSTPAQYQAQNLGLAFAAVYALDAQVARIDSAALEGIRLPGRCDRISQNPLVVVDGAINGQSARVFLDSIQPNMTHPAILVTALPEDKDYRSFFDTLLPVMDQTIITQANARHLVFRPDVYEYARSHTGQVHYEPDVEAAFRSAMSLAGADGAIYVVGTQSLVRDALCFWDVDLERLQTG